MTIILAVMIRELPDSQNHFNQLYTVLFVDPNIIKSIIFCE